jgi:hypothetical protein
MRTNNTRANQNINQKSLLSIRRTQADVLSRHDASLHVAIRTHRQTSSILKTVNHVGARAAHQSRRIADTLDSLVSEVKQFQGIRSDTVRAKQSGREVFFLGERQDQIMAYLLPLKDNLNIAINQIIAKHGRDISIGHAEWLRVEFERLVDSAIQEKAAQYPGSTATPIDQWSYPEDTVGYLKRMENTKKPCPRRDSFDLHSHDNHDYSNRHSPKSSKQTMSTWSFSAPPVNIKLFLPTHQDPQGMEEVGLCYSFTQNNQSLEIRARFIRDMAYGIRLPVCTHLNVFTKVKVSSHVEDLLESGSVYEFSNALQEGTISPYFLDEHGDNICLAVSLIFLNNGVF